MQYRSHDLLSTRPGPRPGALALALVDGLMNRRIDLSPEIARGRMLNEQIANSTGAVDNAASASDIGAVERHDHHLLMRARCRAAGST